MDSYEHWLRQLMSDLASFSSARRQVEHRRTMEMIEYSTTRLRELVDTRTLPTNVPPRLLQVARVGKEGGVPGQPPVSQTVRTPTRSRRLEDE